MVLAHSSKVKSNRGLKEGYEWLVVERYKKSQRLHHWVHVGAMITFFLTGFELFIGIFFIGDYFLTRTFHYMLGIFIGGWDILFFSYLLLKHKKLNEILPTPRDILDLVIILLCALRILPDSKYPHYDFYIVEEKRYVMKYHPAQKFLATTNFLATLVMGVTGIALAEGLLQNSTGIMGIVALAIVSPFVFLNLNLRLIHFLVYLYFMLTTGVHFYFAIVPANRNRLRGMVTGKESIPKPVAKESE